jgi:hypothetical protein
MGNDGNPLCQDDFEFINTYLAEFKNTFEWDLNHGMFTTIKQSFRISTEYQTSRQDFKM